MVRKDTFCANFCRQVPCSGDPDTQPCAICGWSRDEHITCQQLEDSVARGEARLIVNRNRFRLYIYRGFQYRCTYSTLHVWRYAAGNSKSDFLGIQSHWVIRSKTPETAGRRRGPAKTRAARPEETPIAA